jgi:hypothetical protein
MVKDQCGWSQEESSSRKKVVPVNDVIDVNAEVEREQKRKRKMSLFTVNVMTSNLTTRMGQMKELKEDFDFLDRMRGH